MLADIVQFLDPLNVHTIAIDPYNAQWIASQLMDVYGYNVRAFRQGFLSMSPAIKELERRYLEGELAWANPILLWMAGNVKRKTDDAGNIKYVKESQTARIDCWISLAMACGVSMDTEPARTSVYEHHGIVYL